MPPSSPSISSPLLLHPSYIVCASPACAGATDRSLPTSSEPISNPVLMPSSQHSAGFLTTCNCDQQKHLSPHVNDSCLCEMGAWGEFPACEQQGEYDGRISYSPELQHHEPYGQSIICLLPSHYVTTQEGKS